MEKLSKALQESYVAQALALGVLAHEVAELPSNKVNFDLAFTRAWRRFPHQARFPTVLRPTAADPIYVLLHRSEGRRGPLLAAWNVAGQTLVPYLLVDWSLGECGDTLAEWSGVPWSDWVALAGALLEALGLDAR